jgi:hypothetical protein
MQQISRPQPGDGLKLKASTFNAILDAMVAQRGNIDLTSKPSRHAQKNTGVILVKNITSALLTRFACVQIDSPITLPADNADEFKLRIVLKVVTPTSARLPWAIVQEQIQPGETGAAVISGVTIANINLAATTDTSVDSTSGSTLPKSGVGGPAEILWVAGGVGTATSTGNQLAVIRLGSSGGGAGNALLTITGVYAGGAKYSGLIQHAPSGVVISQVTNGTLDELIDSQNLGICMAINLNELGTDRHDFLVNNIFTTVIGHQLAGQKDTGGHPVYVFYGVPLNTPCFNT